MKKVEFTMFDDEIEERINVINQVTQQIISVSEKIKKCRLSENDFYVVYENICKVLNNWTGNTYIGIKKQKNLEKAFQIFFETLYSFLILCQKENICKESVFYQGKLYRYLGHGSSEENTNEKIDPEYNNVYVSWSKNPTNSYIESKLYGVQTLITCELKNSYLGINLEAFNANKGEEAEVVFPTIEETITEIRYIL